MGYRHRHRAGGGDSEQPLESCAPERDGLGLRFHRRELFLERVRGSEWAAGARLTPVGGKIYGRPRAGRSQLTMLGLKCYR